MAKSSVMSKVGGWAFIVGVVIAIIIGLFAGAAGTLVVSILMILGLIVGFLNVTGKETNKFLLAAVSLVIVAGLGGSVLGSIAVIGGFLQGVLNALMLFVVPATIIVALKAIYATAQD